MPTTAEITQRYVQAHADIASAITAKGGTVSAGDGFEEFPTDIATIPSGSKTDFRLPLNGGAARPCANSIITNIAWESYDQGDANLSGMYIWTDGDNIYYSYDSTQYVLDKSTHTWSNKTWIGLTGFRGDCVWTDGDNIYYSYSDNQYVLDKSTSTWTTKTWSGYTPYTGQYIWTDGESIYYSGGSSSSQYVLDKSTSTWTARGWTGINPSRSNIWTDGINIYSSTGSQQYVLNKSTRQWNAKTWTGSNTNINGARVWTDGINIYYSNNTYQYVLRYNDTWETVSWTLPSGVSYLDGQFIWTDGEDIYYDNTSLGHAKLVITKATINVPSAST